MVLEICNLKTQRKLYGVHLVVHDLTFDNPLKVKVTNVLYLTDYWLHTAKLLEIRSSKYFGTFFKFLIRNQTKTRTLPIVNND